MRALIQRVEKCSVTIDQLVHSSIGHGLLILLGVEDADKEEDIQWLARKISNMRIFNDADGVMNESVTDISGEVMVVSQFTLHASIKKGNRPSYLKASKGPDAIPLYERFISVLSESGLTIKSGSFGADMKVQLLNDGPVTIWIDTKNKE